MRMNDTKYTISLICLKSHCWKKSISTIFIWSPNFILLLPHINTELLCLVVIQERKGLMWLGNSIIHCYRLWGTFLCFTESREPCSLNLLALSSTLWCNTSNVITEATALRFSPGTVAEEPGVPSTASARFSILPTAIKRARPSLLPPFGLISFFMRSAIQFDFLGPQDSLSDMKVVHFT